MEMTSLVSTLHNDTGDTGAGMTNITGLKTNRSFTRVNKQKGKIFIYT